MAKLNYTTVQAIEELFIDSGYVLDFSNNSFQTFVRKSIGIDIYESEGYKEYCSKGNKLRQIIEMESNIKVAKLIDELLNYYENLKLKNNELTDYSKKRINDIRSDIQKLKMNSSEKVVPIDSLKELIQNISTRNAKFDEMATDEKLKELGNLIEYLLKKDGKFITLDYQYISRGLITEENIKSYRKAIQCFRHSAESSITERKEYSEQQKRFMIEYGIVVCNMIYNEIYIK